MQNFYITDKDGRVVESAKFKNKCWINLVNPTDDEVEDICKVTNIPEDMLKAALDEEERARYEVDEGNSMYIVDFPVMDDDDGVYSYNTIPIAVIYNEKCIVTISLRDCPIVKDFISGRVKGISFDKPIKFLLTFFLKNANKFLLYLKQIDRANMRVQASLRKSMKNKELIELMELENSLVYFKASLASNERVYNRLERNEQIKNNEDYQDLYDDVVVESKQALEMCNIYFDVLGGTMDAYASVISNNVNTVMKMLTIITMIFTIPTLIASLWGMNVSVPFENLGAWGFWIVCGIAVILTTIASYFIVKYSSRVGTNTKRKKINKK